ncbi:MAG: hypothetical protein K2N47_00905, partial [Clostridia bacterium]|nr:hypothetical protein [Clostridia bacterium]
KRLIRLSLTLKQRAQLQNSHNLKNRNKTDRRCAYPFFMCQNYRQGDKFRTRAVKLLDYVIFKS